MFEKRVATETSNTVERLTAAGMFPLGKLHMVEFAFGGWGTNPLMGAPWNPWDLETHRAPGGSSSGTGVAVAARLAPAGIGSDTGGSVRIPSAFNGLVGLKVTFGRISLHGTMLLSWTLDSIGPMARCVEDCALMLNALAAPDPRDPTTLGQPLEDFTAAAKAGSIEGMRVAAARHQAASRLHASRRRPGLAGGRPDLREPRRHRRGRAPARLVSSTCRGRPGTIIASEAYVAASRLHRGHDQGDRPRRARPRAAGGKSFAPGAYAEELRRMSSAGAEFADWMRPYDAILLPTMAVPAIPLAEVDETSPIPGYLTRPATISACAASPCRPASRGGLPVGIQIVGKPFAERDVLRLGKAFQDATDFHRRAPGSVGARARSSSRHALRHALRDDGLHDRGVERLVLVIADRLVELGAGLHVADHVLRAAVALDRGVELRLRLVGDAEAPRPARSPCGSPSPRIRTR